MEKEPDDLKIQDEVIGESEENGAETGNRGKPKRKDAASAGEDEETTGDGDDAVRDSDAEPARSKGNEAARTESIEMDGVGSDSNRERSHRHNGLEEQERPANQRTATLKMGEEMAIVVDISNQVDQE